MNVNACGVARALTRATSAAACWRDVGNRLLLPPYLASIDGTICTGARPLAVKISIGEMPPSSLKRSSVDLPDGSFFSQSSRPTSAGSFASAGIAISSTSCAPSPTSPAAAAARSALEPHWISHGSPEKKTALSCVAFVGESTCRLFAFCSGAAFLSGALKAMSIAAQTRSIV